MASSTLRTTPAIQLLGSVALQELRDCCFREYTSPRSLKNVSVSFVKAWTVKDIWNRLLTAEALSVLRQLERSR